MVYLEGQNFEITPNTPFKKISLCFPIIRKNNLIFFSESKASFYSLYFTQIALTKFWYQQTSPWQILTSKTKGWFYKPNHYVEQWQNLGHISTSVLMCSFPSDFSEEVGGRKTLSTKSFMTSASLWRITSFCILNIKVQHPSGKAEQGGS